MVLLMNVIIGINEIFIYKKYYVDTSIYADLLRYLLDVTQGREYRASSDDRNHDAVIINLANLAWLPLRHLEAP